MTRPVFIAHHVRTGVVALNVVSAALGADPRTRGREVRFAVGPQAVAESVREARAQWGRPGETRADCEAREAREATEAWRVGRRRP
ncbi:MAG: hypothetical protein HYZ53_07490 [Planctomycetes bacterium]|nr:hypothetical protein [Planctomycetota bacterium]